MTGTSTNPYFIWYDSPGVFRIKGDGIMAYYNPSFTKYTPGATAFERVVQQWVSNVAQYGTEKGTTGGTARDLALITDLKQRVLVKGSTGSVAIGDGSTTLATNATDGFLYVPTCAGPPTGTPTTITGTAPIVADATNNKLYLFSGGAWQLVGP